jgi:hypothetical protein
MTKQFIRAPRINNEQFAAMIFSLVIIDPSRPWIIISSSGEAPLANYVTGTPIGPQKLQKVAREIFVGQIGRPFLLDRVLAG